MNQKPQRLFLCFVVSVSLMAVWSCATFDITEPEPGTGSAVTHTVVFSVHPDNEKMILVEPEIVADARQSHFVVFVNTTGKKVTVDFTINDGSTPLAGDSEFTIDAGDTDNPELSPDVVKVNPDVETDYTYRVTSDTGSTPEQVSQSPRIRVGPKD